MCQLKSEGGRCNGHRRTRMRLKQKGLNKVQNQVNKAYVELKTAKEPNPELEKKFEQLQEKENKMVEELFEAQEEYLSGVQEKGLRLPGKNQESIDRHKNVLQEMVQIAKRHNKLGLVSDQLIRSGGVIRDFVGRDEAMNSALSERNEEIEQKKQELEELYRNSVNNPSDMQVESLAYGRDLSPRMRESVVDSLVNQGCDKDSAEKIMNMSSEIHRMKQEGNKKVLQAHSQWLGDVKRKLGIKSGEFTYTDNSQRPAVEKLHAVSGVVPSGGELPIRAMSVSENSKKPVFSTFEPYSREVVPRVPHTVERGFSSQKDALRTVNEELKGTGFSITADDVRKEGDSYIASVPNVQQFTSITYQGGKHTKPKGAGWKVNETTSTPLEKSYYRPTPTEEFGVEDVVRVNSSDSLWARQGAIVGLVSLSSDVQKMKGFDPYDKTEYPEEEREYARNIASELAWSERATNKDDLYAWGRLFSV